MDSADVGEGTLQAQGVRDLTRTPAGAGSGCCRAQEGCLVAPGHQKAQHYDSGVRDSGLLRPGGQREQQGCAEGSEGQAQRATRALWCVSPKREQEVLALGGPAAVHGMSGTQTGKVQLCSPPWPCSLSFPGFGSSVCAGQPRIWFSEWWPPAVP